MWGWVVSPERLVKVLPSHLRWQRCGDRRFVRLALESEVVYFGFSAGMTRALAVCEWEAHDGPRTLRQADRTTLDRLGWQPPESPALTRPDGWRREWETGTPLSVVAVDVAQLVTAIYLEHEAARIAIQPDDLGRLLRRAKAASQRRHAT